MWQFGLVLMAMSTATVTLHQSLVSTKMGSWVYHFGM